LLKYDVVKMMSVCSKNKKPCVGQID
jgi:hypothetical protein